MLRCTVTWQFWAHVLVSWRMFWSHVNEPVLGLHGGTNLCECISWPLLAQKLTIEHAD